MQQIAAYATDFGIVQELDEAEINAVGGGTFLLYAAAISAGAAVYSGGEKIGKGIGRAIYSLTHSTM